MPGMDPDGQKAILHRYLQNAREALLWKLAGLSEYDVRRPLTPTGTNLLGLVKHVASVEIEYFGDCFDRPSGEQVPWVADDAELHADMWATPEQSRGSVVALYHRSWAHADATIGALPLDAPGRVLWWSEPAVTLQQVMVHMLAETQRHAGHADIVRELVDGACGMRADHGNLPDGVDWPAYARRVEAAAATFGVGTDG